MPSFAGFAPIETPKSDIIQECPLRRTACGALRLLGRAADAFDADAAQQVEPLFRTVLVAVDHAPDAGLDDEFRALDAGGRRNVERRTVAVVGRLGDLRNGVRLGMEHVGFRAPRLVLADVLEARGRAVVAVRNDHLVLDDQRSHLAAHAVGVLGPDACHPQVAHV